MILYFLPVAMVKYKIILRILYALEETYWQYADF